MTYTIRHSRKSVISGSEFVSSPSAADELCDKLIAEGKIAWQEAEYGPEQGVGGNAYWGQRVYWIDPVRNGICIRCGSGVLDGEHIRKDLYPCYADAPDREAS